MTRENAFRTRPDSPSMISNGMESDQFDITDSKHVYAPCPACKRNFGMGLMRRGEMLAVECDCGFRGPEALAIFDRLLTMDRNAFDAWNALPRIKSQRRGDGLMASHPTDDGSANWLSGYHDGREGLSRPEKASPDYFTGYEAGRIDREAEVMTDEEKRKMLTEYVKTLPPRPPDCAAKRAALAARRAVRYARIAALKPKSREV